MYSLIYPSDVWQVIQEYNPVFELNPPQDPSALPSIMQLQVQEVKIPKQPAPSENAVIPFTFQQGTPSGNESEIGYSSLICDGTDNDIILAATQIEENVEKQRASAISSSKAIIKNQKTNNTPTDGILSGW